MSGRGAGATSPDKLGFPLVAVLEERGRERYVVVDGQHRVAAVRQALGEDQQIQCEVIRGCTIAEAAELFCGRNESRKPRPLDQFLVGVTAKRPENLAIVSVVENLGLRIRNGGADGSISAVSALIGIYRGDHALPEKERGATLRRTLLVAMNAWGGGYETFNGDVLRGLGAVLARYGLMVDDDSLQKKLASLAGGALGLLGKGRTYRTAMGGSMMQNVARAVVTVYNAGRRSHQLPDWDQKTQAAA